MGKTAKKRNKRNIATTEHKKKNKRLCYSKENLRLAVQEVKKGKSIATISREYNIPESTLRAKKSNKYADKKPGPAAVLTTDEENELVDWIFKCSRLGFPVTKPQLLESVQGICLQIKKTTPFIDNKPGRSWYESFLKRHPEISERISENVCLSRAKVTEESLRKWFNEISEFLTANNLLFIEENRIFNCDETAVSLNPKPPAVLAPKGSKNVYNIVGNNEKENLSVLVTGNAAGELAPTFILFAGKSLPKKAAEMAPTEFAFGFSENGWMIAKTFYEFIVNVFEPWLTIKQVKRPVVLYIDGHSSHLTLHLSKFCSEHEIVLIALHPNSTHIIQPLDVSFFRSFKAQWQQISRTVCESSASIGLKNYQFAPVLKKTLDAIDTAKLLRNGFKKCGLCPFDVGAIDFTKVFKRNQNLTSSTNDSEIIQDNVDPLQVIESLMTIEKLQAFRLNKGPIWKGLTRDESLFEMWYKLSHPDGDIMNNCYNVEIEILNSSLEVRKDDLPKDIESLNHSESIPQVSMFNEECVMMELDVDPNGNILSKESENYTIVAFAPNQYGDRNETQNTDLRITSIEHTVAGEHISLPLDKEFNQSSVFEAPTILAIGKTADCDNAATQKSINSTNASCDIMASTDEVLCDSIESELNKSFKDDSQNEKFQSNEQLPKIDVLHNILNTTEQKSSGSVKKFLTWPNDNELNQKNKRTQFETKMPSVVSGAQWQEIKKMKEDEKLAKAEQVKLRKKLRIEKQEQLKIKKESDRIRKEEEKFQKEKQRVEKEREKLLKQQKKIKDLEEKKKATEILLLKQKERKDIKKRIEALQNRENELK